MQTPGYVALSRQISLTRALAITANNIANLDTPGFKRQSMLFDEHVTNTGDAKVSYVTEIGTARDLTPGAMNVTQAPLDFAIQGEGYFSVETPIGVRYGRGGHFQLNAASEIVTKNGYRLLGEDGAPIVSPDNERNITVEKGGVVRAGNAQIGRIQVVTFENQHGMIHTADGLLKTDQEPLPSEDATILQGAVERSNVNPVMALVTMLDLQKDYQGIHRMIKAENDRLTRGIREIGRVEQG